MYWQHKVKNRLSSSWCRTVHPPFFHQISVKMAGVSICKILNHRPYKAPIFVNFHWKFIYSVRLINSDNYLLQTLYTYPDNFRAYKALIAAQYSGAKVKVAADFVFGETNKSDSYLKKFPTGKVCTALSFCLHWFSWKRLCRSSGTLSCWGYVVLMTFHQKFNNREEGLLSYQFPIHFKSVMCLIW